MKYTLTKTEYENLLNAKEKAEKKLKDFKDDLKTGKDLFETKSNSGLAWALYSSESFFVGEKATEKIVELKDKKINRLQLEVEKLKSKIEDERMLITIGNQSYKFDESLIYLNSGDKVNVTESWPMIFYRDSGFQDVMYQKTITRKKKWWQR